MVNLEINKFEQVLKKDITLRGKLLEHAEKISNEIEFNDFLENEIMPIVKKHGINLTKEELLNFEKESLKELDFENLSQVSGGVSLKPLLMSVGILSILMLGTNMGAMQTSASNVDEPILQYNETVVEQTITTENENVSGEKKDSQEHDDTTLARSYKFSEIEGLEFETERLILTPTTDEDKEILSEYLLDKDVTKYLGPSMENGFSSKEKALEYLNVVSAYYDKTLSLTIKLKENNYPIGRLAIMLKKNMKAPNG